MSERPLLFLDANVLASPVTRTLVIAGARADNLRWTWSKHVEEEADHHSRNQAAKTSVVRQQILGTALSPTASYIEGLATKGQDRQVIADAIKANARYVITANVDDFSFDDLATYAMSVVNPDYFMMQRFSECAYREGVHLLASVQKNPTRTEAEVHQMLSRRHPRLASRFVDTYDLPLAPVDTDQPTLLFRGSVCIRCDSKLINDENNLAGLCEKHLLN